MESIALWFAGTLGKYISSKLAVFIVSLVPILECRGGLIASALLKVDIRYAVPLCILGNILPIPFILLFIKRIFKWLKKFNFSRPLIEKLENRAMNKSKNMSNGEFLGLLLFVGIPLPGTGAWTGSLVVALLDMDFKKAITAIFLGILLATLIVSSLSYGLLVAF
ncbi:small multi-drug export protein [Catenibacterium sp. co_0103]|uniref:COG2426 family protein n=1 Tax=Catenibacterium sp. co_0103 TaxID=2478954 RepID=UPI00247884CD|nr:small multi-drug export protein [Catenibacterium sp. co_0103]